MRQLWWRGCAALLLTLLAALLTTHTVQAAPAAQVDPCNGPGTARIIDPAGGRLQVRMYGGTDPAGAENYDTSIQEIVLANGQIVYGYCIDSTLPRPSGVTVCLVGEISNLRLFYLVGKYPPDLQDRVNQAARQAAVWHFSNGINLDLNDATPEGPDMDAAVAAIYTALLAEVNAIDPANPPAILNPGALEMAIAPPSAVNQLPGDPDHAITVTLTKGGLPLPGIEVQVAANLGQFNQPTATTNASGQAVFTLSSAVAGTANITATALVTVPVAYEYVVQTDPTGLQPFGVPGSSAQIITAFATKQWSAEPPPPPGRITLTKNVQGTAPGEAWTFSFTLDGGNLRTATNLAPQVAWEGLASNRTYVLQEADPGSGWTVGSFACLLNGAPVGSAGPGGFEIPVAPGADISCSITNTRVQPPALYAVGDLVWLDIAGVERDGIQQDIERESGGVNGVRVELYDGSGAFLGFRLTAPDSANRPGYYLFADLPAGRYQVRFCLPDGYQPTLQNQGGDDQRDSDGNTTGVSASCGGPFYATEVFDLPNSLTDASGADLSRDFGLWRPAAIAYDYGDNPVPYPTQKTSLPNPDDAARHVIVDSLYFGALVDAEPDGQPATPADGDDRNGALGDDGLVIDDEDGVTFLTPLQPCTTGQVQLSAVTGGRVVYYGAFFDWNGDAIFGPGEGYTGEIGVTGAPGETTVITVTVPCGAVQLVYTRFRLALDAAEVQVGTGEALSGEVEDYVLAAVGDRVWYDRNGDGLQGPVETEEGVEGVVAALCDGATGQLVLVGGQPLTTTTDADGIYGFYNLPLGSYCVQFDLDTLPEDYTVTKPNMGGDDGNDSDADDTGRTSSTGVMGPVQVDLTLDMGIVSVTPTAEEPTEEPAAGFRMYLPHLRN